MALYGTRYGLPQSVVDYLNQALPNIDQSPYVDESPAVDPVNILSNDESSNSDAISQLISNEYVAGGGGGDFSVYNPSPNQTRDENNYNPYNYNRAMRDTKKYGETVMPNPDLFYKPQTGIEKLIGMLPGQKVLKGIKNMLPVNRTGILQNELLGAGFQLNDIGQIVSDGGEYDTAGNVMSGYNTSKMTEKTFDDRIAGLGNMTPEGKAKRTEAILEAKQNFIDAKNKTDTVFDAISLAKDPNYQSFSDITKQGLEEEKEDTDEQENFDKQLLNQIFSKINQKQETEIKDNKELLDKIEKEQKQKQKEKEALAATEDNKDGKNDFTGTKTTSPNIQTPNQDLVDGRFETPKGDGNGGSQYDGPGDTTDASGTEGEDQDRFARGGRVTFLNGGLANLIYLLSLR